MSELTEFKIQRDGLPPLVFTGTQLAEATNRSHQGPTQNRWTIVNLYRTKGGKIITHRRYRTQWQGESGSDIAASHATAAEAIEWLKEGGDRLGGVSQEAIETALKVDPEFAAAFVETVD